MPDADGDAPPKWPKNLNVAIHKTLYGELQGIKEHYGLQTDSEAVRLAIRETFRKVTGDPRPVRVRRSRSRKKS